MAVQPTPPKKPPSTAGSVRSRGSSRLSAASRQNLEGMQGRSKITSLIEIKVQMDATESGKPLSKRALARMHKVAKTQASAVFASAVVDVDALPPKMGPGCFRPGVLPEELARAIAAAAVATAEAIATAPTPAPQVVCDSIPEATKEQEDPQDQPHDEPKKPYSHARRLPNINVAGKQIPLETMIRDKVAQKGGGGGHQLRKMFQVFDTDGTGTITAKEMDEFLRYNNIKVNKESLTRFFETWAAEKSADHVQMKNIEDDDQSSLNYLEFIDKILPADYPHQDERRMFADNIASMAYQDRKVPLQNNKIQSVREFIPAFQEKVTSKLHGGAGELRRMFQLFDTTKKGYVTFDDLMDAAKRWTIEPCESVREAVKKKWCPLVEDGGVIDFDAFVVRVLPTDFTDLKELQRVFHEKLTMHSGAMKQIFRRMDVDKGGTIDKDELLAELQRMNIQITPELADEFAKQFDEDGDGEIDFAEFSRAVRNMDPDKQQKASNPVGLLWEPDPYARQRIEAHRPISAGSIHSVAGDAVDADRERMEKELEKKGMAEVPIAGGPLRNEELREYTMPGQAGQVVVLDDGTCLVDGVPTDFIALLREKIHAKFKSGYSPLLRLFKMMDAESDGKITMPEFKRFLEPYNLNLSKAALEQLMYLFDSDGDGAIDYNEFCQRIVPDNYQKLLVPDTFTGKPREKMQGIPAMVWQPPRHFAEHSTPTVLAPFDSKAVPPYPGDDRAVNLLREKLAQRSRNSNDRSAAIRLRDALQLYDTAKNGRIPRRRFREVLERYSVFLSDEEFADLCNHLPNFSGGQVAYKPFLNAVVSAPSKLIGGAFGPHVPAPWMRRAQLAREESLLDLDRISTPMANRPDSVMSAPRSARGATPRSVRKDALDELSKNMYYTARVSSPCNTSPINALGYASTHHQLSDQLSRSDTVEHL